MTLKHIVGLDHVVILARELDAAAQTWRSLGFTVSPRGTHSPHLGSANYTIMLEPDYIELLGILAETPHNAATRDFLARRGEGMERAAFTTTDAAAGVEEIRAKGFAGLGPVDFGRPVTLPSGGETAARFRVFQWPVEEMPGGLRIFACQHLTPEAVWIPELKRHANAAKRLKRVEVVSADPHGAADHMARLIDRDAVAEGGGIYRVPSGGERADFVFMDKGALAKTHPGVEWPGAPDEGAAALVVSVADLAATKEAVGARGVASAGRIVVPRDAANGIAVAFEQG